MSNFRPTLTLSHHESGWDGTFGMMLDTMAGVLDDGPVDAQLTYWERETRNHVTVTGRWIARDRADSVIVFYPDSMSRLLIDDEDVKELSI